MNRHRGSLLTLIGCVLALAAACAHGASAQKPGAGQAAAPLTPKQQLAAAKMKIMSADYRADIEELGRQRAALGSLILDPSLGYLAHYWAAFAAWRQAINGANNQMPREEMQAHLEEAVADFDLSIQLQDDFADSLAAAASVNGWLMTFHGGDPATVRNLITVSQDLLTRAKSLAPDNPRVLWVEGGNYLFRPPEYGGDINRAIAIYHHMAEVSDATSDAASPFPDWGKPEAFMSLAFSHLSHPTPDLAAAENEAREALRLQPDWSYVKNVLLPQIETARRQGNPDPAH